MEDPLIDLIQSDAYDYLPLSELKKISAELSLVALRKTLEAAGYIPWVLEYRGSDVFTSRVPDFEDVNGRPILGFRRKGPQLDKPFVSEKSPRTLKPVVRDAIYVSASPAKEVAPFEGGLAFKKIEPPQPEGLAQYACEGQGLSPEDLARIEANRQKALERRKRKQASVKAG